VDQRLIEFCWTAAGGIGLGGIGALFGGLAGYAARLHGQSPGGFVGWRVLRAIERVSRRELPPLSAGIVVGAFDGAAFLGAAGAILGFLASRTQWLSGGQLLAVFYTFAVVAALAAVMGMAAYSFTRGGILVFGSACTGGLAGIYIGALLAETPGMMAGAWVGLLSGFLVGSLGRRAWPRRKRRQKTPIEFEERQP
jgi:hypothetical protein